jgi:hypothetical protein
MTVTRHDEMKVDDGGESVRDGMGRSIQWRLILWRTAAAGYIVNLM